MTPDERTFLWINRMLDGPFWITLMKTVTWLGNGVVLALLVLPALFVLDRPAFRRHALPMIVVVALSGGIVNLAKIAVDRPRPPEHFAQQGIAVTTPTGTPPDRSFPSGHAQTAFGTAVYLSCLYPAAAPAFLVAASLVGLSRVALGVHYPLDVLVGALCGALFSLAAFHLVRRRGGQTPAD
jgi:undecaprenyl-diphosphatase